MSFCRIDDTPITRVRRHRRCPECESRRRPKTVVLQRGGVELEPITVQPQYDAGAGSVRPGSVLVYRGWIWSPLWMRIRRWPKRYKPGDTVLHVDGEWVYSRESYSKALDEAAAAGEDFDVLVERTKDDNTLEDKTVSLPSSSVSNGALAGVTTEWVDGATLDKYRRTPWQACGTLATSSYICRPSSRIPSRS